MDRNNSTIFWTRTAVTTQFNPWYTAINMRSGEDLIRRQGHNEGYGFIPVRRSLPGEFLPPGFQPQVG